MLLVPDNRLAEIQSGRLENGWIIGAVGIATPDVKFPYRIENACNVAIPRKQQPVEFFAADKIVGQRPVLGTKLFRRRLRLLGVAGYVESLVVRGSVKGR